MKVTVDEDRCRGHGMCLTLCPEVFHMHDDGYAVADPSEVPAGLGSRSQRCDRQLPRASHQRNRLKAKEIDVPKGYIIITEDVKDPAGMAEYGKLAVQGDGRLDPVVVRFEARGARGGMARHPDRRCSSSTLSKPPANGTTPTLIRRQSSFGRPRPTATA